MRNAMAVFCLAAVAGNFGVGPGDALAQSNGKTFSSDKPCEIFC